MKAAEARTALISRWLLRKRHRPGGNPRWTLGIYKADRLGDFVLALGAIRRLVAAAGAQRSVLVITGSAAELAAREFPETDLVIVDPCRSGAGAAAVEMWRRRGEDLFGRGVRDLVCLRHHRNPAESVTCGGIPAATSWGVANSELLGAAARLATMRFDRLVEPIPAALGECLELARHRAVVGAFLGRSVEPAEIAPVVAPGWEGGGSAVAVSPFGTDSIRDAPRELLAAAGRHLRRSHGLRLELLCPPGQERRFRELASWLAGQGVEGVGIVVCDTTDDLREALRRSRLVLSVETGTAHLATALDAPLVAFLGGGHIGWFAPWTRSERQQWLTNPVACSGCGWQCSQPTPICLTGIPEGRARDAIDAALSAA
jgi:ADP-heptose:LPS heptosyltransferase